MNKYKLVKKAYYLPEFFIGYLGCPYYEDDFIVWGKNINEAKSNFLKDHRYDGLQNCVGEEFTYLNLKLHRYWDKNKDLYEFEGRPLNLYKIERILEYRAKLEEYKSLPNKYCYKKKGSYYRPNNSGYTDYKHKAGVYTMEDGIDSYIHSHGDVIPIPIDIEKHNNMIQKEINDLKLNLINE